MTSIAHKAPCQGQPPRCLPALTLVATLSLLLALSLGAQDVRAQSDGFDPVEAVLIYHKLTGQPLDLRAAAEQSELVRRASNFDRQDALKAEIARLQAQLDAADPQREFRIRVNDSISQYDHERGEFSIMLFAPGYFVPVQALRQNYQIVFANAESARSIAMPKEQAREFDAQLNRLGRGVVNEVRFRIVGKGDPAGAVTGANVVRAELLAVRLLDRQGRVVFTPTVAPLAAAAAGSSGAPAGAANASPSFDIAAADVAGFRVGVKARDLESSLQRLFGAVVRAPAGKNTDPRFGGALTVNDTGCIHLPGRRNANVGPGSVCVTAFFDGDEVVRSIRVERVFSYVDGEVFRKTLVGRYGAVAAARNLGSSYSLGWGPEVDAALLYDRSGPRHALTAHYVDNRDYIARSGNALPQIRVVLQLVDADWAARSKR